MELPAGQASINVPFEVDGSGKMILLITKQPGNSGGYAGYREIEITHAVEAAGGAPQLRPVPVPETDANPELAQSLFGAVAWRPQQLVVRGGQSVASGLELRGGGEVWLHTDGMNGEIRGQLASTGAPVLARVVWYKGGRLQVLQNGWVMPNQPFDFKAWTAEPGGWFGVLLDGGAGTAATVRVTAASVSP